MKALLIGLTVLTLSGCAAQQVAGPSPEYAPVIPEPEVTPALPTGSIYNASHADSWFGEKKSFQVGDVVTILLDESLDAGASATNSTSRSTTNEVLSPLQLQRFGSNGGLLSSDATLETDISSEGSGVVGQSASVTGTMSAQVVEVYANGNLLVRGEKIVTFTTGSEVVQVKGIIRPEDVQPDNTVQSKRLASAQITYKGAGSSANAQRVPWGTNLFLSLWPF